MIRAVKFYYRLWFGKIPASERSTIQYYLKQRQSITKFLYSKAGV